MVVIRTQRTEQRMQELALQLSIAKQNMAQLRSSIEGMERELVDYMEAHQRKTMTANSGQVQFQVTYVRPTRVVVDEVGLRKALGARVFDRYTVRKLDRSKLEEAIDKEEVSAESVSPYVREEISKAYIRTSERKHA